MIKQRLKNIDIVRGVVMVLMALDHVRDLLHVDALTQSPTDLNTTTPWLFFSRWITYLCAPTFVFLSGTSVSLAMQRQKETGMSRSFLIKRGVWLILLEFTLVNFALWFDFQFRLLMLQVIAAIGAGFIILSTLLKVPTRTIGIAAALLLVGAGLLQFVPPSPNAMVSFLRNVLFTPGIQQVSPDFAFFISYPVIPWTAIMLLGYSFGPYFETEPLHLKKITFYTAWILLAAFVVLRLLNSYGDPAPWQIQKNPLYTLLSFVNVTKYPPSLQFTLLFLGLMFIGLRYSESLPPLVQNILSIFGRVPLFYYIIHLYIIRLAVFIMVMAQGYHWSDLQFGPFQFGRPASGSGLSLSGVCLVWLVVVAMLYPLCKWYGDYKRKNKDNVWLKYL